MLSRSHVCVCVWLCHYCSFSLLQLPPHNQLFIVEVVRLFGMILSLYMLMFTSKIRFVYAQLILFSVYLFRPPSLLYLLHSSSLFFLGSSIGAAASLCAGSVSKFAAVNKMGPANLAIVFGPILMKPSKDLNVLDMNHPVDVLRYMISCSDELVARVTNGPCVCF